jgi:uncharacterized Zn finger protein (UPF0148 family)
MSKSPRAGSTICGKCGKPLTRKLSTGKLVCYGCLKEALVGK